MKVLLQYTLATVLKYCYTLLQARHIQPTIVRGLQSLHQKTISFPPHHGQNCLNLYFVKTRMPPYMEPVIYRSFLRGKTCTCYTRHTLQSTRTAWTTALPEWKRFRGMQTGFRYLESLLPYRNHFQNHINNYLFSSWLLSAASASISPRVVFLTLELIFLTVFFVLSAAAAAF